jgi:hypothetical protein
MSGAWGQSNSGYQTNSERHSTTYKTFASLAYTHGTMETEHHQLEAMRTAKTPPDMEPSAESNRGTS